MVCDPQARTQALEGEVKICYRTRMEQPPESSEVQIPAAQQLEAAQAKRFQEQLAERGRAEQLLSQWASTMTAIEKLQQVPIARRDHETLALLEAKKLEQLGNIVEIKQAFTTLLRFVNRQIAEDGEYQKEKETFDRSLSS